MKAFDSNISYDTIDIFIQNSKSLVHLKNVASRKYEATNVTNLNFFGMLKETELIGKTLQDIDKLMLDYWGSNFIDSIEDIEKLVVEYNKPIKTRNIMFNRMNRLTVLNTIKYPVLNKNNVIKSILTSSEDITNNICPAVIYRSYRVFKNPKLAVVNFLKHFEIQEYFENTPSEAELLALIAFANRSKKSSNNRNQINWDYIDSLESKIYSNRIQSITEKIN